VKKQKVDNNFEALMKKLYSEEILLEIWLSSQTLNKQQEIEYKAVLKEVKYLLSFSEKRLHGRSKK
jgi:hypothetical protein